MALKQGENKMSRRLNNRVKGLESWRENSILQALKETNGNGAYSWLFKDICEYFGITTRQLKQLRVKHNIRIID